eukprot:6002420-Pleurochrysis_carterae.AAC.1
MVQAREQPGLGASAGSSLRLGEERGGVGCEGADRRGRAGTRRRSRGREKPAFEGGGSSFGASLGELSGGKIGGNRAEAYADERKKAQSTKRSRSPLEQLRARRHLLRLVSHADSCWRAYEIASDATIDSGGARLVQFNPTEATAAMEAVAGMDPMAVVGVEMEGGNMLAAAVEEEEESVMTVERGLAEPEVTAEAVNGDVEGEGAMKTDAVEELKAVEDSISVAEEAVEEEEA